MAGGAHDVGHVAPGGRERPLAHADRLRAPLHARPALARAVAIGVPRVELLLVEVRAVVVHVRAAPGQAPVAAQDHAGGAGQGHPRHVHLGRGEVHGRPDRGHAESEVGIVGEQRPTGRRVRAGDHPVVAAASGLRERLVRARGHAHVAAEEDPVLREEAGEEHLLHVGSQAVEDGGAQGLVLPALGEVEGEQLPHGERVHGLPAARRVAQQAELEGQGVGVGGEPGVHPLRVGVDEGAQVGGQPRQRAARGLAQAEGADVAVGEQGRLAEGLRELAFRAPAQEVHLPHPVLRRHVSLGAHEVAQGGSAQVGHAHGVPADQDGRGEAAQARHAVHLGKGAPREAPPRARGAQADEREAEGDECDGPARPRGRGARRACGRRRGRGGGGAGHGCLLSRPCAGARRKGCRASRRGSAPPWSRAGSAPGWRRAAADRAARCRVGPGAAGTPPRAR